MSQPRFSCELLLAAALTASAVGCAARATEPQPKKSRESTEIANPLEIPGLKRLSPDGEVWVDAKGKRIVLGGRICLREGPLEMFACTASTKEHESIVAVNAKAFVIHAALLALGADPGKPVEYRPEYRPASGPEVEVWVYWRDDQGKLRRARGQDWVLNMRTGKPLDSPWVFAGSGFWRDETTGERYYLAEDGDLICVSNFPSAMLDLPVESSQANDALVYEANAKEIPPLETKVSLVLQPKPQEKKSESEKPADDEPQPAE